MSMESIFPNPVILVLFGSPGAGKGTFVQTINAKGKYVHLSTGDLMRDKLNKQSELGVRYKDAIMNREINQNLAQEIQEIVTTTMLNCLADQKGFILDGYPATQDQCTFLDDFLKSYNLEGRVAYVFIDVPSEVASERIQYRQICEKCTQIYNKNLLPSKNNRRCTCGGTLIERMGDDPGKIKSRLSTFDERKKMIMAHYKTRLIHIDGTVSPQDCVRQFFASYQSQTSTKVHSKVWYLLGLGVMLLGLALGQRQFSNLI